MCSISLLANKLHSITQYFCGEVDCVCYHNCTKEIKICISFQNMTLSWATLLKLQYLFSWFVVYLHFILFFLRVTSLTRLPPALVELSEPMQVIRYEQGDFSNAHHDSGASHTEAACSHTRLTGNTSALAEVSCRYDRKKDSQTRSVKESS